MGKCTEMDEFTVQYRGGKGVKCYKITEKTGDVVGVKAVNEDNEVMLITNEGIIIRLMVSDISVLGRITSGVKLISMDTESDIRVASLAKVRESNTATSDEDIIKNLEKDMYEENIVIDPSEYPDSYDNYEEFDDEETYIKESYEDQLENDNPDKESE
jgi:DNA gyrase subunit A